jgi:ABC-type transport system involved in multi-copper enzyme maturation permease subunit
MKALAIASVTFRGFLHNKVAVLVFGVFGCIFLLGLAPTVLLRAQSAPNAQHSVGAASLMLSLLQVLMIAASAAGSLLSAWLMAATVAEEIKSGTILAVMARPLRRWEFLLGKYLGVMALMGLYTLLMLGFSNLLSTLSGEPMNTSLWILVSYPIVRYAIYAALALLLATRLSPVAAFTGVLVTVTLAFIVQPESRESVALPHLIREGLYVLLPSLQLLSESRFISISQGSLQQVTWPQHLLTLAYGIDYAAVIFLVAVWAFRRRSLVER